MSIELQGAVADLVIAGSAGAPDLARFQDAARGLMGHLADADPAALNDAAGRLVPLLEGGAPPVAGVACLCCGAMVENGADPAVAADAAVGRLPEFFAAAAAFAEECESRAGDDDGADPVEAFGREVGGGMPAEANTFMALDPLGLGVIAMLSKSKPLRRRFSHNPDLVEGAARVARRHARAHSLLDMFQILDDETLIVIHPEQGRGFQARAAGLSDNFQLHTLIMGRLIGDPRGGWLEGERPDPRVIEAALDAHVDEGTPPVTGQFNLFNWPALSEAHELPGGTDGAAWWVWNEGRLADVMPFQGARVVLLGPPAYQRGWSAGRRFPNMPGEFTVERQLDAAEVADRLGRIAAAPKPPTPV